MSITCISFVPLFSGSGEVSLDPSELAAARLKIRTMTEASLSLLSQDLAGPAIAISMENGVRSMAGSHRVRAREQQCEYYQRDGEHDRRSGPTR